MTNKNENIEVFGLVVGSIVKQLSALGQEAHTDPAKKTQFIQSAGGLALLSSAAPGLLIEQKDNPHFVLFEVTGLGVTTNFQSKNPVSLSLEQASYTNHGNSPSNSKFAKAATFTDTVSFGFKEGLKVGASAEFGFDIGVVNAKISISTELNFEANQQITKTQTLKSVSTTEIEVPPHSVVKVSLQINEVRFEGPYTAQFRVEFGSALMNQMAGKSMAETFPGIKLDEITQTGYVNGTFGYNWQTVIGNAEPIPPVE